jgi:hypothetical protein
LCAGRPTRQLNRRGGRHLWTTACLHGSFIRFFGSVSCTFSFLSLVVITDTHSCNFSSCTGNQNRNRVPPYIYIQSHIASKVPASRSSASHSSTNLTAFGSDHVALQLSPGAAKSLSTLVLCYLQVPEQDRVTDASAQRRRLLCLCQGELRQGLLAVKCLKLHCGGLTVAQPRFGNPCLPSSPLC